MNEQTTIIEINGVKMEVDLRHAKVARIDTLKVGSKVKLLRKGYSNDFTVNSGVVVGFDDFKAQPTIRIAYIETCYSEAPLKFFAFNASSKDCELLPDDDDAEAAFSMATVVGQLDRAIELKRIEHEKAVEARRLFLLHFGAAFTAKESA